MTDTVSMEMPGEFDPHRLRRRGLQVIALLVVLGLVAALAPGLDEVRDRIAMAEPSWVAIAIVFELLSCLSYVAMFRPVFRPQLSRRTTSELAWAELGVGALVPASGAGGLALGAWMLRRTGMEAETIARRTVAFFLIKSLVNFILVVVTGTLLVTGVMGPHRSPWLSGGAALLAAAVIAIVLTVPLLGPGRPANESDGRIRRAISATRQALVKGVTEAFAILRSGNLLVIVGAIGYCAWDIAMLWACFEAIGASPSLGVILMGYLVGQLGGALPLPAGIGGVDGGLIGALIVYGAPAAASTAAVLLFRLILFWLPLVLGGIAFALLRRALDRGDRTDLGAPTVAAG